MELPRNSKFLATGLLAALVLCARPVQAQARGAGGRFEAGDSAIVQQNVMVPMRDGTLLSTDIYIPKQPGKYPTILMRDCYDNGSDEASWEEGLMWAGRGYVFIHQDVRGRYDSEGSWYPYINEAQDGYDTQNWIGQQDWSNGTIGTYGGSYLATTQWKGAEFRSPFLKAIAPRVTPFNYYFDTAYPGGALALGSRIGWASGMGGRTGQGGNPDWDQVIWHLPLLTMGAATSQDNPWWRDFVSHPVYDAYWQVLDSEARLGEFDVPSLNIGGWYDVFLAGTLVSYTGMVQKARSEHARKNQKLVIGPWPHASRPNFAYKGISFGPAAVVDFDTLHVKWFDALLKGKNNGYLSEPPVSIFIMGENVWRHENEWPLARTQYTTYYLHGAGNANTRNGDGTISTQKPARNEPVDEYTYDPKNPVPTRGGNLMFQPTPPGPDDQAEVELRNDVLVFSTPVLDQDVEVTGPVWASIYAATSARDTDFTVKLVDVHPDGKVINVADGILRGRFYKNPTTFTSSELLTPGAVNEFKINLWATSNLFKRGHRIRIEVSSSNFPKYDRNLNSGNNPTTDTQIVTANQTIYHNAQYPSNIILPIIPR